MQTHYHRQVVKAKFVCKHGACQQVGDLQCKCGTISVARRYEISHFVVNADAESSVDVISVEQPAHADQHQVQIVNGRALDDPVHSTCHELNTHTHTTLQSAHVRQSRRATVGRRSFTSAGPRIWNGLAEDVTSRSLSRIFF